MRRRLAHAVPLACILLLASGCKSTPGPGSGAPPDAHSPSAGHSPAAVPMVTPTIPGNTPDDSVGTVQTTFRGTDGRAQVSCDAIDTKLVITPHNGRIRWTAYAGGATKTTYPFVDGIVSSVTFDPPSGLLDPGQSQVLDISGSFTGSNGSNFYVAVAAPNSTGGGASTIEFFCD
jgi:hypothetical protein